MLHISSAVEAVFMSFACVFTEPTFQRMLALCVGAILTRGRRTVTNMIRGMGSITRGHWNTYHRVFSRAQWSLWPLGRILAGLVLHWVPPDTPLVVSMDDTTAQHRGRKVYGKGCHHDAVRSTHKHIVYKWGHKWVVLAIIIKFPFASRPWALPILVALYRPRELNEAEKRRHKTPAEIVRQLMAVLVRWFPERRFIFLGDGGYASHELASAASHRRCCTLISRFRPDANLYAPPPEQRRAKGGRPRLKGEKLPSPREVVRRSRLRAATVCWYGGGKRKVGLVSGVGYWYKAGCGLTEVRWVYVKDLEGTHRDEWFFSTDVTMRPLEIVSLYTSRWSLDVTFQEVKERLGFETTRQRVAKSVLRMAPFLLGLYSVVCLLYGAMTGKTGATPHSQPWYEKDEPTFSDALTTVRRLLWQQVVFESAGYQRLWKNLPTEFRDTLLEQLSCAA